jgi:hypothetical protein
VNGQGKPNGLIRAISLIEPVFIDCLDAVVENATIFE